MKSGKRKSDDSPMRAKGLAAALMMLCFLLPGPVAAQTPDLIQRATETYYQGDLVGAANAAQNHAARYPRRAEGLVLLGRVQMAQGEHEAAFGSLRQALDRDPKNVDALYYLGLVTNILAGAEFQQLVAKAPHSARAHQFMAESYVGEGNTAKAAEEYQAALALEPRSVEILVALANLERSRSRYDEAVEYYTRAIEIDPGDYGSVYGLGLVLFRRGDYQKSLDYFRRASELDPAAAVPRMALGMALFHSGDATAAIPQLESAIAINPKLRQAFTYLAQAYHVTGRSADAKLALQKATELAAQESKSDQRRVSGVSSEVDQPTPPSSGGGEVVQPK